MFHHQIEFSHTHYYIHTFTSLTSRNAVSGLTIQGIHRDSYVLHTLRLLLLLFLLQYQN